VGIISTILCFYVLWLSFTANVRENSWEFGVLRALGLSGTRVIRLYIYEALCLVFSCIILGTIVGSLISITLTLQFNLFTELPFQFSFPVPLYTSVMCLSIAVAIFGSYLPARKLANRQISRVIRGN